MNFLSVENAQSAPATNRGTPSGVRVPVRGPGVHYAQYSFAPGLRILNGFVQSLVGLYDFGEITGDAEAQRLFASGQASRVTSAHRGSERRRCACAGRHSWRVSTKRSRDSVAIP